MGVRESIFIRHSRLFPRKFRHGITSVTLWFHASTNSSNTFPEHNRCFLFICAELQTLFFTAIVIIFVIWENAMSFSWSYLFFLACKIIGNSISISMEYPHNGNITLIILKKYRMRPAGIFTTQLYNFAKNYRFILDGSASNYFNWWQSVVNYFSLPQKIRLKCSIQTTNLSVSIDNLKFCS